MQRRSPWYTRYEDLRVEIEAAKAELRKEAGKYSYGSDVLVDFFRDHLARMVHESNWQEGVYLDFGKTKELAGAIFCELGAGRGPRLDLNSLVETAREGVLESKRAGKSIEELAAESLSRAHMAIAAIADEFAVRTATAIWGLVKVADKSIKADSEKDARESDEYARGFLERISNLTIPLREPLTDTTATIGELVRKLEAEYDVDEYVDELMRSMKPEYVHCIHRITMMGILPASKCGAYRKGPVNVGNPDVVFPPASVVPGMMEEYCREFPVICAPAVKYEPILMAAKVSHRFVRIHPYADGNGRVSRLLMNLVLWDHHPPALIKADGKGRHRYAQALRRSDKGNL